MLHLSNLLISSAFAQDASAPPPSAAGSILDQPMLVLSILLFGVWYLMVIRPHQKKMEEQAKLIKALQRGDRIVTSGGIHGKISKIESDDLLMVEIADGVEIKIDRAQIQGLEAKTQPVTDTAEKK